MIMHNLMYPYSWLRGTSTSGTSCLEIVKKTIMLECLFKNYLNSNCMGEPLRPSDSGAAKTTEKAVGRLVKQINNLSCREC